MTHLDVMKRMIEDDPWEIAHRLWTCMECPKLRECLKNVDQRKIKYQDTEGCRKIIDEWLNEEIN